MKAEDASNWPVGVHERLAAAGVRMVAYVPDAGVARLIELCQGDETMTCVPLTTEEEGVALAAGAWLGGRRIVLLMQSSGVGNCLNMLSLVETCRLPLLMLIAMRGEWGEFNPWQVPMGRAAEPALELAGATVHRVDHARAVTETVEAAARLAFSSRRPVAVLLSQRLVGVKRFEE